MDIALQAPLSTGILQARLSQPRNRDGSHQPKPDSRWRLQGKPSEDTNPIVGAHSLDLSTLPRSLSPNTTTLCVKVSAGFEGLQHEAAAAPLSESLGDISTSIFKLNRQHSHLFPKLQSFVIIFEFFICTRKLSLELSCLELISS